MSLIVLEKHHLQALSHLNKMLLVNVCFDIKNGLKSGLTYFGSYELDDILLSTAIKKTQSLKIESIEAHTHRCHLTGQVLEYTMYPKGNFTCGCCNRNKEVSKTNVAFVVYDPKQTTLNDMIVYKSLVCLDCRNKIGAVLNGRLVRIRALYIEGKSISALRKDALNDTMFRTRCVARRWKKKTAERVRVKNALTTLTYPIMHWACKPNGPLYRLAMRRLGVK